MPAEQVADEARKRSEPGPPASEEPSLGVALSGGGIRAALFSLGVLIGLVEMRQAHRIRHLSSVSGGSLTSAAFAQRVDLSRCTNAEEFHDVAAKLARLLTGKGTFFLSPSSVLAFLRVIARGISSLLFVVIVPAVLLVNNAPAITGATAWIPVPPWPAVVVTALLLILLAAILGRGRLQEGVYGATLAALPRAKHADTLASLPDSRVHHVFIATDLVSGSPIYFGRDFVFSPLYGWGRPAKLRTATAVYASAAFPVVFPPRRVRRHPIAFRDGRATPPYPRLLKLTDGGVHNNLGTDWFAELERQDASRLWRYGNLPELDAMTGCDQLVIVNAGAASRGFHRVLPFLSIRRTMTVLYDNTVQPRLNQWRVRSRDGSGAIVIDINDSPVELVRNLRPPYADLDGIGEDPGVQARRDRAKALLTLLLSDRDEEYWSDFARQTSRSPTKLTRTGVESGARMMMHGYLSAVAALSVTEDLPLPAAGLRGEDWFLDLAGLGEATPPPATAEPEPEPETETEKAVETGTETETETTVSSASVA